MFQKTNILNLQRNWGLLKSYNRNPLNPTFYHQILKFPKYHFSILQINLVNLFPQTNHLFTELVIIIIMAVQLLAFIILQIKTLNKPLKSMGMFVKLA